MKELNAQTPDSPATSTYKGVPMCRILNALSELNSAASSLLGYMRDGDLIDTNDTSSPLIEPANRLFDKCLDAAMALDAADYPIKTPRHPWINDEGQ